MPAGQKGRTLRRQRGVSAALPATATVKVGKGKGTDDGRPDLSYLIHDVETHASLLAAVNAALIEPGRTAKARRADGSSWTVDEGWPEAGLARMEVAAMAYAQAFFPPVGGTRRVSAAAPVPLMIAYAQHAHFLSPIAFAAHSSEWELSAGGAETGNAALHQCGRHLNAWDADLDLEAWAAGRGCPTPLQVSVARLVATGMANQWKFTARIAHLVAKGGSDDPSSWAGAAIERYGRWLALIRAGATRGGPSVPSFDVDFAWHTHMRAACNYGDEVAAWAGRVVNHLVGQREGSSVAGGKAMAAAWTETYGDPFQVVDVGGGRSTCCDDGGPINAGVSVRVRSHDCGPVSREWEATPTLRPGEMMYMYAGLKTLITFIVIEIASAIFLWVFLFRSFYYLDDSSDADHQQKESIGFVIMLGFFTCLLFGLVILQLIIMKGWNLCRLGCRTSFDNASHKYVSIQWTHLHDGANHTSTLARLTVAGGRTLTVSYDCTDAGDTLPLCCGTNDARAQAARVLRSYLAS